MIETAERVRQHRQRMRQEGFRLLQVWVPDTSAPGFAAEARRQAELVARAAAAEDTMDWVEAVAAPWDE